LIEPPQVGIERLLGDPEIDPWHRGQSVPNGNWWQPVAKVRR
jgi:hypothetical protein